MAENTRNRKNKKMKKELWFAVIGLFFVISSPRGDETASTDLSAGNNLLDWIVTNSLCSVTISLQSTNATGGLDTCGAFHVVSFRSFKDFQLHVANNGSLLFRHLNKQSVSGVRFRVSTTYEGLSSRGKQISYNGLAIDTYLGLGADVTTNSFFFKPIALSIILPISGVTSANIKFGNDAPVSMSIVGTNRTTWNSLFTTNSGRVRVTLTFSDGEKVIYTQGGNPILPPTVAMDWKLSHPSFKNPYSLYLLVGGSAGADTVVENTTNFISWTSIEGISWDSSQTKITIPISEISDLKFFRAKSD